MARVRVTRDLRVTYEYESGHPMEAEQDCRVELAVDGQEFRDNFIDPELPITAIVQTHVAATIV